jgi:hypothetical protein
VTFAFLAILLAAAGGTYLQKYSYSTFLTNDSSPIGHDSFIQYKNDDLGISIDYPASWHILEQTNGTVFSPFVYNSHSPQLVVQIDNSEPNESLDHYLNNFVIDLGKVVYDDYKVIHYTSNASLGGHPAYLLYFTYTEPYMDTANIRKDLETGTIIDTNKVYYIYYDADVHDYATYLPYVERMIQSFKILSESVPSTNSLQNIRH